MIPSQTPLAFRVLVPLSAVSNCVLYINIQRLLIKNYKAVWSHVFDLADLFVASLVSDKTKGKRLLSCAGRMSWEQAVEILRNVYPDRPYPPVKADAPCMNYPGAEVIKFDTVLEEELLGGKWRSLEETVLSCAHDLLEKEKKGWDKF